MPQPNNKTLFVLKALALKTPVTKVKQDYQVFFEEKITGDQIMEIEKAYSDLIAEIAIKELNDVRANPLAHTRVRLDLIYECLKYAMKARPVRSVKISDNEYEQVMDIDHQAIAKYLQLARDEEYNAKKLLLEKIKLDLDIHTSNSGFEPIEISDGFAPGVKQIESS